MELGAGEQVPQPLGRGESALCAEAGGYGIGTIVHNVERLLPAATASLLLFLTGTGIQLWSWTTG